MVCIAEVFLPDKTGERVRAWKETLVGSTADELEMKVRGHAVKTCSEQGVCWITYGDRVSSH